MRLNINALLRAADDYRVLMPPYLHITYFIMRYHSIPSDMVQLNIDICIIKFNIYDKIKYKTVE